MPKQATKLTKKQVKDIGPGRYADGNGLYLIVEDSGARRWIVRVNVRGQLTPTGIPKRRELGLGNTVLVPLEEARVKAIEYQRLAKEGIDPKSVNRKDVPTFEIVARADHEQRKKTMKNGKHVQQRISTLETYVFPAIGGLAVDQVDQTHVLQCVEPIWAEKNVTASRVLQRISNVLDVAKAKGHRTGDNPVQVIQSANVLPKITKQTVKHHDAMAWQDVPEFFERLKEQAGMSALALYYLPKLLSTDLPHYATTKLVYVKGS